MELYMELPIYFLPSYLPVYYGSVTELDIAVP